MASITGCTKKVPRKVLQMAFLITNGSFWFLSVFCAMFLASEVWRFHHTTFFINTESVRRAVTGILVFGTLVAYVVGLIGCCAGMRINRSCMLGYLGIAAIGFLFEIVIIICLFAGSELSLAMTNIAWTLWTTAGPDIQNLIQLELHCCGFDSPADKTEPDVSCYEIITDNDLTEFKPYTVGCRPEMENILKTRWAVLRIFCAIIAVVQLFGFVSGANIFFRTRPAPVTVAEQRLQKKPKLKYQPLKKTQKPTTAAPDAQPGETSAGGDVGPGSGTGTDGKDDQEPSEDTRPTTSRQSHASQGDGMPPVDVPEVTTTQSPAEGDTAREGDATPDKMSPAEGDTAREDDVTSTSPGEGDVIPDDEPVEQDDDTAPLVTEDSDTTPAPDNKTGGNTPDQ